MAEINPPTWLQGGSHGAQGDRRLLSALLGDREGVLESGDLTVTESGPDMSVDVATGMAAVAGTENTYQGLYVVDNQGTTNLTISASDPTNDRYDLVVARIYDSAYGTAVSDEWALEVIEGTAAATPLFPTVPDNCLVLATVLVEAAVSTITNAAITNVAVATDSDGSTTLGNRGYLSGLGGVVVCTSTIRPTDVYIGMVIFETDTSNLRVWNGTVWDFVSGATAPYALASNPSNQTVTNGSTDVINFTTQQADTDGFHDGSSAKFTIPAGMGGMYAVSTVVNISPNASGRRYLGIYLDSAASYIVRNYMDPSGAGASHIMSASATAYMPAGAQVYCNFYQDSGSSIDVGPGSGSGLIGKMNIVKVG